VGGRSGADHIDEADDGIQGGVDADAHVRAEEIVVNSAGEADDRQPAAMQHPRAVERAIPADDDKAVDPLFFQDFQSA